MKVMLDHNLNAGQQQHLVVTTLNYISGTSGLQTDLAHHLIGIYKLSAIKISTA